MPDPRNLLARILQQRNSGQEVSWGPAICIQPPERLAAELKMILADSGLLNAESSFTHEPVHATRWAVKLR
jgi:hypothetical protein